MISDIGFSASIKKLQKEIPIVRIAITFPPDGLHLAVGFLFLARRYFVGCMYNGLVVSTYISFIVAVIRLIFINLSLNRS